MNGLAWLVVPSCKFPPYLLHAAPNPNYSIYATRTTLATFYNFRIESLSSRLKDHQQERAKTIKKLKDATKYDSTLELIEKYGGEGRSKGNSRKNNGEELGNDGNDKRNKKNPCPAPSGAPNRTRMPPPATANIPRPGISSSKPAHSLIEPGAEFAPNAEFSGPLPTFPVHQGPSTPGYFNAASETHWYDRIFDVLLGEDETAPKNRIVLICQSCRLINGQAPPGTKTLSELGSWKCMSCGATNGEMDEGKRIVNEVLRDAADTVPEMQEVGESSSDDAVEIEPVTIGEDDGPAAVVKKRRGNGKK